MEQQVQLQLNHHPSRAAAQVVLQLKNEHEFRNQCPIYYEPDSDSTKSDVKHTFLLTLIKRNFPSN